MRPRPSPPPSSSFVRVNGKIRAREVRLIGVDNQQLGVVTIQDALNQARANGVDLVEIAPNAVPPVCKLIDFGKYRYEQAKKEKESKKHQHANKIKEVQLSASIDPHDFGVKLTHAIDFLCEEMKVKISLRFRGREMAHKEIGMAVVEKFLRESAPYGHPDFPPKLIGKSINAIISPLPRNKRAKNPKGDSTERMKAHQNEPDDEDEDDEDEKPKPVKAKVVAPSPAPAPAPEAPAAPEPPAAPQA